MIGKRNNFKPFPYVFGSGSTVAGLGLSGPGGILWPIHPGVSTSLLKAKSDNIPSPMLLSSIEFGTDSMEIEDQTSVTFSFIPNLQKLIVSGSFAIAFGDFANVYYSHTQSAPITPGTSSDDLPTAEGISPVVYVVFAYDGSPGGLDTIASQIIKETAPFDILLTFSGSITPDIEKDSRTGTVSFGTLILAFDLSPTTGGYYDALNSSTRWITSASLDNDWNISIDGDRSVSTPASSSVSALDLVVSGIRAISHPEQVGYAAYYWGGLMSAFGQSATILVRPTTDCQSVLGPCWLPHTTFYPLVDIGRTPLNYMPTNILEIPDDDLAYRDTVEGYGMIERSEGIFPPEQILSSPGQLLNYPLGEPYTAYHSFQPNTVDTRILQDTCIYPVVGPEDTEKINAFWTMHARVTKTSTLMT